MSDFCPNCETPTMIALRCRSCGTDYHTGRLKERRRNSSSLLIPTMREALPSRVPVGLRDKEPKRNRCGLRTSKTRILL